MIEVKLFDLLKLNGSDKFVPHDISSLVASIEVMLEESPEERHGFGLLADKLDETREHEMAAAARYIAKRPKLVIFRQTKGYRKDDWMFAAKYGDKPDGMINTEDTSKFLNGSLDTHIPGEYKTKPLIGLIAALAAAQVKMLEDLT